MGDSGFGIKDLFMEKSMMDNPEEPAEDPIMFMDETQVKELSAGTAEFLRNDKVASSNRTGGDSLDLNKLAQAVGIQMPTDTQVEVPRNEEEHGIREDGEVASTSDHENTAKKMQDGAHRGTAYREEEVDRGVEHIKPEPKKVEDGEAVKASNRVTIRKVAYDSIKPTKPGDPLNHAVGKDGSDGSAETPTSHKEKDNKADVEKWDNKGSEAKVKEQDNWKPEPAGSKDNHAVAGSNERIEKTAGDDEKDEKCSKCDCDPCECPGGKKDDDDNKKEATTKIKMKMPAMEDSMPMKDDAMYMKDQGMDKCPECGKPKKMKDSAMYMKDEGMQGCACGTGMKMEGHGMYASDKGWLKVAQHQSTMNQTEPVDAISDDKELPMSAKSEDALDVPRSDQKAKPEGKWSRPKQVDNPNEVRKTDYGFGPNGKDVHTDVVPRDGAGDGLGGESVNFAKDNAVEMTSGDPDNYVQSWQDNVNPTPSGNEMNHGTMGPNTASGELDLLKIAKSAVAEAKKASADDYDAIDLDETYILVAPWNGEGSSFKVEKASLVQKKKQVETAAKTANKENRVAEKKDDDEDDKFNFVDKKEKGEKGDEPEGAIKDITDKKEDQDDVDEKVPEFKGKKKAKVTLTKPIVEGQTKNNPWAICTDSVGREDKEKYEDCVQEVKKDLPSN